MRQSFGSCTGARFNDSRSRSPWRISLHSRRSSARGKGRKGVNTDETYLRRIVGFRRIYPAIISAAVSECSRHKWALSLSHEQRTAPTWLWRQRDTALSSNNIIIVVVSSLLNRGIASSLLPSLSSLSVSGTWIEERRKPLDGSLLRGCTGYILANLNMDFISFISALCAIILSLLALLSSLPPPLLSMQACLFYDVRVIPFHSE